MVLSGYWPATPQLGLTYYSIDLFEQWNAISCQSPGTSLSSFVKSIDCISANAGKVCSKVTWRCSYVIYIRPDVCSNDDYLKFITVIKFCFIFDAIMSSIL